MSSSKSFFIAFGLDAKRGEPRSYFMSEEIESVQAWIANGGRRTNLPIAPEIDAKESRGKEPSHDDDPQELPFWKLTNKFIRSMDRHRAIMSTVMTLLPRLEISRINRSLYQPLANVSKQLEKTDRFEMYECDFEHIDLFGVAAREIHELKEGRDSLPGMFLMGLISSYDAFLADLMQLIFLTKPEMLSASEKNISFKDLVELGSIEAARNQIIEKEVETFLRQNHYAQFDILESRLGIPLRKDLAIWPSFVEICERRNLFTHTNGVVSRQYLQVCAEHDVKLDAAVVGEQLKISARYLLDAVAIITELGCKLTQVVWRKLLPKQTNDAAHALIDQSFELLKANGFELARKMLEFGLILRRQSDEESGKMMVVNLAIAVKLAGDAHEAKAILSKEDWTASNDKFRICVAAVLDDIDEVVRLMPNINEQDIDKDDFREWPAFKWMSSEPRFAQAFELKFKEPFMLDRDSQDESSNVADTTSTPAAATGSTGDVAGDHQKTGA